MTKVHDGSETAKSLKWIDSMRATHPRMSRKDLESLCRRSYPFGKREGWPYRAWLKAMGIYFKKPQRKTPAHPRDEPVRCKDTFDMFESNHAANL